MNLLGLANGVVQAANPSKPILYRASTGYAEPSKTNSFKKVPAYAEPVAFTGSITNNVLTVSAIASGQLAQNQTITGTGVAAHVTIQRQLTGSTGETGTYQLAGKTNNVASESMTAALYIMGQVQALQYKDLQQIDALNLNGTRRKVYLFGVSDGVVRSLGKGGDLLTDSDSNVWLVALVLEQWQGWCSVAVTLQNGS